MPDEHGNFVPGGNVISGKGGTLRRGHRVISDLVRWTAKIGKETTATRFHIQMTVLEQDADPFWIEHAPASGLRLEIDIGSRTMRGDAKIVRRDPFVIDAILEE